MLCHDPGRGTGLRTTPLVVASGRSSQVAMVAPDPRSGPSVLLHTEREGALEGTVDSS